MYLDCRVWSLTVHWMHMGHLIYTCFVTMRAMLMWIIMYVYACALRFMVPCIVIWKSIFIKDIVICIIIFTLISYRWYVFPSIVVYTEFVALNFVDWLLVDFLFAVSIINLLVVLSQVKICIIHSQRSVQCSSCASSSVVIHHHGCEHSQDQRWHHAEDFGGLDASAWQSKPWASRGTIARFG